MYYCNGLLPDIDYDDVTRTSSPGLWSLAWPANSGYQ